LNYRLENLIDLTRFQEMLDSLHDAVDLPTGIVDQDGRILTASGWQDICVRFHRANPTTAVQCRTSDQYISDHVLDATEPLICTCPMGLIDSATPIVIDGKHLGNVFIGQFFLGEPDPEHFRRQAKKYGFDEEAYLKTLSKVPVLSKERLERNLVFIRRLAEILCKTGLKQLKLMESEQRFRTIFDSVNEAIFLHDPETGEILDVNAAMTVMFGYTREEARRLSVGMISSGVHPYTQAEALARIHQVAGGEPQTFEWQGRKKDGTLFWGEVSIRKARIIDREFVLVTTRDITERKQLEDALMNRELEFRTLAENAPDLIFRYDQHCRRVYVNKTVERKIGIPAGTLLGKLPWEEPLCIASENAKVIQCIRTVLATGRPLEAEVELMSGNEQVYYHFHFGPIVGHENQTTGVIAIGRDITEHRRIQNELVKTQKLESVGLLAGGIAHDFNNLLTGILGNISFAKSFIDTAHRAFSLLERAEKASLQATELAKQLLVFAKGSKPVKKIIPLSPLIHDAVSLMLRGTTVRHMVAVPDTLHAVDADAGQLSQACNNILINAVQAMPNGGTLTVNACNLDLDEQNGLMLPPGAYVKISFTDQGVGISSEDLRRILDPFFTTKTTGTGLGLTTTYRIVKAHGGNIGIRSTVGKGSTFSFYLPSTGQVFHDCSFAATVCTPAGNAGAAFLVMDDEEVIRELAADILEHLGCQVSSCADGQEAVRLYREAAEGGRPFTAVLMDLTIPGGMGGKEAAQAILAIDPAAYLIVSSGYSSDPVMAEYRQYGFSAAIAKPYTIEEIDQVVKNAMLPRPCG